MFTHQKKLKLLSEIGLSKKKKEWLNFQKETNPSGTANSEDFEKFLQKDDAGALEKINLLINHFDVNKIKEAKEKEAEKKEHPRERERENKKKQLAKDQERSFKKKLEEWLIREEQKERERKREKERDKERERDKIKERQRYIEKELTADTEMEKKKKNNPKYQKELEERRRARQKELEEDEMERRKELKLEQPPEPTEGLFVLPTENIMPMENELGDKQNMEIEEPAPMPHHEGVRLKKFTSGPMPSAESVWNGNGDAPRTDNMNPIGFGVSLQLGKKLQTKTSGFQSANAFKEEGKDDDGIFSRKHKPLPKLDPMVEKTNVIRNIDMSSKSATITFNTVQEPAPQDVKQGISDVVKKQLETMIAKIPTNKTDLFAYPINWTLLATSNLLELKIRPWLAQKCKEYIGAEEINFINMILKKLANREPPNDILKKVEMVLEDEAEDFVMKLWRMIIFELMKFELNVGK